MCLAFEGIAYFNFHVSCTSFGMVCAVLCLSRRCFCRLGPVIWVPIQVHLTIFSRGHLYDLWSSLSYHMATKKLQRDFCTM